MCLQRTCVVMSYLAIVMFGASAAVAAEGQRAPWNRSCAAYATPKEFVGHSAEYCLRERGSRQCLERAEVYFGSCRFRGNFKKLSQRIHAKMVVMLALSRWGSMSDKKNS